MIEIDERDGGVTFAVRVVPRASRNSIEGEHAGALKVRLTAPPVEGRANEALRRLLAERLNVPLGAVRIVAGEANRTKRVSVAGVSPAQVIALCAPPRKESR
ncbi:MAG TPA: DUF167 domain-containing protein [Candidatus Acidoferrales bacterium]|nr:DUF167 domain-containing protein [Candidatus Acidoferrales bacterium]